MNTFYKFVLVSLLLLVANNDMLGAAEISISVSNIALKPNSTQNIKVTCNNKESSIFVGQLLVHVEHNINDSVLVAKSDVVLNAGETKEFAFSWVADKEYWGCAATATMFNQQKMVQKKSYNFVVTSNLPLSSPAMGISHSTGKLSDVAIRERIQEFADCGIPIVELFSWSPGLWGGTVAPEAQEWYACQGAFLENRRSLSTLTTKAHELGMLVYSYAQSCFRGKNGLDWLSSNPDDALYRTPEGKLDKTDKPDEFAAYANPLSEKSLNESLDSYAKAFKMFKIDGIRWDGHPGIFYNPIGDWISRNNNSVSSFPYKKNGEPIVLTEPDQTNAKILQFLYNRLNQQVHGLQWGFNFCLGSPEYGGGYNTTFPTLFRKLVAGNIVVQERHFHHSSDGKPYIWINQKWSSIIEDLSYSSELINLLDGYLYRGDYSLGWSESFLKHAFAIHYASRSRTFAVAPWYKQVDGAGKFPYDFVRFALRYNKFLFHPSLSRFNVQKPLQRVSVSSKAPFPVMYENFCYDLFLDKKFRSIVHVINTPMSDQVNARATPTPALTANTIVSIRHPLGMDKKTAKIYVLSPEWPEQVKSVEFDPEKPVVNIEVPPFQYWAVAICEYTVGAGEQKYSAEGELFLPVLHRAGEL